MNTRSTLCRRAIATATYILSLPLLAQTCPPLPDVIPVARGCLLELGLLSDQPLTGINVSQGVKIESLIQIYGKPLDEEKWRAVSNWDENQELEFSRLVFPTFRLVVSHPVDSSIENLSLVHSLSINSERASLPCKLYLGAPFSQFKLKLGEPRDSTQGQDQWEHRYHWNHFYCQQQRWGSEEASIVIHEQADGNVYGISWDYLNR